MRTAERARAPVDRCASLPRRDYRAWITTDNGGSPGTPLETFTLTNVRPWTLPTVSAMHVFSTTRPALTASTTHWLVIGPNAPNTVGSWNYSLDDAPSAGSANFLVNGTASNGVPQLSGPWVPADALLWPAFQVDMR